MPAALSASFLDSPNIDLSVLDVQGVEAAVLACHNDVKLLKQEFETRSAEMEKRYAEMLEQSLQSLKCFIQSNINDQLSATKEQIRESAKIVMAHRPVSTVSTLFPPTGKHIDGGEVDDIDEQQDNEESQASLGDLHPSIILASLEQVVQFDEKIANEAVQQISVCEHIQYTYIHTLILIFVMVLISILFLFISYRLPTTIAYSKCPELISSKAISRDRLAP